MGNGEPHASTTLMTLGELTSFLRLGSFKYWHEVIALAHALSCNVLHVIPIDNSVFAWSTVTIMHNVKHEIFIFKKEKKGQLKKIRKYK